MNIALWIVQVLLALVFLMAGAMKLMRSKEQLGETGGMGWIHDFSSGAVRLIGVVEVLGMLGLILPAITGVLTWLTPVAAVGLALLMLGAVITHARRGEYPNVGMNFVLLALAAFTAYGRFVSVPF